MAGLPTFNKSQPNLLQCLTMRYDKSKHGLTPILGTLPKGALVSPSSFCHVQTVFDGTTPTLKVGTTTDDDAFFASADIAPGTAAVKQIVLATLTAGVGKAPLAADTDIQFTFAGGGTNTVGICIVTLTFSYPHLLSDLL